MSQHKWRRIAREEGLPWAVVQVVYHQLREADRERHARPREIRRVAWQLHKTNVPSCWPFWRHGFQADYGKRYAENDLTVVPGYDEIHQEIATAFPEYDDPTDGEHRLFEFLMTPCPRLATADELYEQAINFVAEQEAKYAAQKREGSWIDDIPF